MTCMVSNSLKTLLFLLFFCTISGIYGQSHSFQSCENEKNCPCVSAFGHCNCPHGQCACVPHQGHCDCHSTSSVYTDESINIENQGYNDQCTSSPRSNECLMECDPYCNPITSCQIVPLPQHQIYIGPEIYYANRNKAASGFRTNQDGFVYGGRAGYDRIKRCRIYWGVDGLYASGILDGHKHETKVKIDFTDANIEGRLGYTFQGKTGWLPTFVPYVGYGYYRETSKFKKPSPLQIKQTITFDYVAAGFLSQIYPHPLWVIGLNFKARFLFNSKCKISDDPDYEDVTQNIAHNVQYRVELPVTYRLQCWCDKLAVALVPFYECRHYGEHLNFPFDFKDTRFNFYGFDVRLMYMF